MTNIGVVIPTLNEATNLHELLVRLESSLGQGADDAEVVVVDDGSSDGTPDLARAYRGRLRVRVLERQERGLASAVLRGVRETDASILVVMDADLSHPPESVPQLVNAVRDGAEVAVGSRYVPGGQIEGWPWKRRLLSKLGTWMTRFFLRVRDPLSGFFALRLSLARELTAVDGFKILVEALRVRREGRVSEIPITFRDRHGGSSKLGWRTQWAFLKQWHALAQEFSPMWWRALKAGTAVLAGIGVLFTVLALSATAGLHNPRSFQATAYVLASLAGLALSETWFFRLGSSRAARAGRVAIDLFFLFPFYMWLTDVLSRNMRGGWILPSILAYSGIALIRWSVLLLFSSRTRLSEGCETR